MENATKALLIAAGVLITIIVITIGVVLYQTFSSQTKGYSQTIETSEIQKFNSNYLIYIGRQNITAQEIVSTVNRAKEYNDIISIKVITRNGEININDSESFLSTYSDKTFECIYSSGNPVYNANGKVKQIVFTQVRNLIAINNNKTSK